ncbi:MAG: aspartate racemase [Chloroflexi bacterium RBG_16_48_8]|nr:MAG: aspartate racemase [Chloroflexi bacterium RBG_16_48_8]
MKTIGLIGGMSWESSVEYYRIINEAVRERLGGFHSAKSILYSVDFAEIEILQKRGKWEEATRLMVEAAQQVERGGADFILICTNTMHKMAEEVQKQIRIPLLHIADATRERIREQGLSKIGLLETKFTMEEDFYKGRLVKMYDLEVLVPDGEDREVVHRVIYDELVLDVIDPSSKEKYIMIVENLVRRGAQGVVLGCTEIGLLLRQEDVPVPVFDTTIIHAKAAVDRALAD